MKLYRFYGHTTWGGDQELEYWSLTVCADDEEADERLAAWEQLHEIGPLGDAWWDEITTVDGYRIIVGEKVSE